MKSIVDIISNSDERMLCFSPFRDTRIYFRINDGDLANVEVFSQASKATRWTRQMNDFVNLVHVKKRILETL